MMENSALASFRQGDLSTVYGLKTRTVNNGTTSETVAEVNFISPVYQPLNLFSETKFGRIVTTLRPESDGFSAFLYYRKP
ncbi:hypothetical protein MFIFM68171_08865 [Madurella fahalii]|uniref:Uncharacterized protein n=1 Tax=Madurella fahalii TaxID=1157608 RepID=A0ABQ0GLR4_9PEZI